MQGIFMLYFCYNVSFANLVVVRDDLQVTTAAATPAARRGKLRIFVLLTPSLSFFFPKNIHQN